MLAHVEDPADIGMAQPRRRAGLAVEAVEELRVLVAPEEWDFQGHVAVEPLVLRQVNDPHTAAAELPDDLVSLREGRARGQPRERGQGRGRIRM